MSCLTRQAYLLSYSETPFRLTKDCNQYHDKNSVLLYTPKVADFTALPHNTYDEEIIKAIAAVIEVYENVKDEEGGCKIFMIPKYDTFFNQLSVSIKINFSQGFVDKLCTILAEPKILIAGGFQTVRYDASPVDCGTLEIPLTAGEYSYEMQGFKQRMSNLFPFVSTFSFDYSVKLEWKEFFVNCQGQGNYISPNVCEKLWNEMLLADCTIVASDGTESKCHRNVLAVHSDVLHTMLTSGLRESQTNRIEMDDMSHEGVTILLAYMYGRDLQLEQLTAEVAFQLLRATHKYNVSNLETMLLNLFCCKLPDWFSIDNLLAIYFFSLNISEHHVLAQKMLFILKMKAKELRAAPSYQAMMENNLSEAADLALKLLEEN